MEEVVMEEVVIEAAAMEVAVIEKAVMDVTDRVGAERLSGGKEESRWTGCEW